jgi:hypothetical protein
MGEHVEIENQRVAAAQAFGVPLSRVHISVPYLSEKKRGFDLERQAYVLLDSALQAAVEFKTLGAEVERGDCLGWGDEAGYLGRAGAVPTTAVASTATSTSAAVLPTARSVGSPTGAQMPMAQVAQMAQPLTQSMRNSMGLMGSLTAQQQLIFERLNTFGNSDQPAYQPSAAAAAAVHLRQPPGATKSDMVAHMEQIQRLHRQEMKKEKKMEKEKKAMREREEMLREEMFKQKLAAKEEMFKQKMAATEEIRALCPNEGACAELLQSMFAFDL